MWNASAQRAWGDLLVLDNVSQWHRCRRATYQGSRLGGTHFKSLSIAVKRQQFDWTVVYFYRFDKLKLEKAIRRCIGQPRHTSPLPSVFQSSINPWEVPKANPFDVSVTSRSESHTTEVIAPEYGREKVWTELPFWTDQTWTTPLSSGLRQVMKRTIHPDTDSRWWAYPHWGWPLWCLHCSCDLWVKWSTSWRYSEMDTIRLDTYTHGRHWENNSQFWAL